MGKYSVRLRMSFQPAMLRLAIGRDPDGVERARASSRYMQPTADFDPKAAAKKLMREGALRRARDADGRIRRSLLFVG